jgi:hypothetical protein
MQTESVTSVLKTTDSVTSVLTTPDCTEVGPHIFLVCIKLGYVLVCSGLQLIVQMEATLLQRVRIFTGYTEPYFLDVRF